MMELELRLALRTSCYVSEAEEPYGASGSSVHSIKERFLCEAPNSPPRSPTRTTLPLLRWDHKQPDDDDNDDDGEDAPHKSIFAGNCLNPFDRNKEVLVGWPPVKRWRKRTNRHNPTVAGKNNRTAEKGCRACMRKSTYVKVKMEGVTIARKIDLGRFLSFEALINALHTMFDRENSRGYRLFYRDTRGDWLIAGEESWRNFIESAQLLRLEKI